MKNLLPGTVDKSGYVAMAHDANRLAELAQALDEWIVKGGFLPTDWSK